jgi:colanic acid/amylovoran biosynthesis glycosyltransferase
LKIAYFINQYPKVTHSFIRREIHALERRGFEVQRVALRGWSEELPDPQDQGERERTRYILRHGVPGLLPPLLRAAAAAPLRLLRVLRLAAQVSRRTDRRLAYHLLRVAEGCCLAAWLQESKAERLHAHFGTNSAEVAMYARGLGGPPYSFTVHGPEEFESPLALAEKVRAADFVAAISSFCRAQLYLRSEAAQWPRIHVVHCGLEPAFSAVATDAGDESRRLVCVGRLCEAKGQLLLVEAAARLRAQGVAFELVLAGDGPLRGELEAAITRCGLIGLVRITGWISSERVREELLAARALVLPSFAEGLPVVIMEAMALRRPVLGTFVAGIPELLQPGENGWLFPAGSVAALARAMEACLSCSAEEIRRMGQAAQQRVRERHSADVEAGKLAALFVRGAAAGEPTCNR